MIIFTIILSMHFILWGAVYGRINGGGVVHGLDRWYSRIAIMSAFIMACAPWAGVWSLAAFAGVLGISTGHGQYFLRRDLNGLKENKEKIDFFVSWFFGKDWRTNYSGEHTFSNEDEYYYETQIKPNLYWRCVFGMFCTGFLVGLPAAVTAFCFGATIPALLFLLTGVAKSAAYMIGHKVWNNTESAEYINGGLRNVICLAVIFWFFF